MIALALICASLAAAQDGTRHVFVTVLDPQGVPLEGLTAGHFAVRENGRDRDVVGVEPLRIPMHVAVLVDTSVASGAPDEVYRASVLGLVERLGQQHQVAVYGFGDRAALVSGFTQPPLQRRDAVAAMFGWAHERSFLLDAVDLAASDLRTAEAERPVIIAINAETPEASRHSAGAVLRRLASESIAFHAISLATSHGGTTSRLNNNVLASRERLNSMAAGGEGDRERNRLLEQGTAVTGGSRQRLASTLALAGALDRLVRELANGYRVTFRRSGTDRAKDLQVGVLIEGVTLRATAAPFGTR
jgi:VWFA-related protein